MSRFRIFIRTFALGLAFVWVVTVLDIAWRDVAVELPFASEDVLWVISRYGGIPGGGGGSYDRRGCFPNAVPSKAKLLQVSSSTVDEVRFTFFNDTGCDVYLVYAPGGGKPGEAFYPYSMECLDDHGRFEDVGPDFHFLPAMKVLHSGDRFIFDAVRPSSYRACRVSVGYHRDPRVFKLFRQPGIDAIVAPENQPLIRSSGERVELDFIP